MGPDWIQFEATISSLPGSKVSAINQVYSHIVCGRGKRLRACLVLLMSRALGYSGKQHIELACIVEWLHAATLIHDDIIDQADERSGQLSAHSQFGNTCAVLGGDYLYGVAFKKIASLNNIEVTACIANATTTIIEGELLQLQNKSASNYNLHDYNEVIARKTACLFEVCSETAAIIANSSLAEVKKFGFYFGMAYQMLDDVQDYLSDSSVLGRNPGNDYAEGKLTLPYILAKSKLRHDQQVAIEAQELELADVVSLLIAAGGFSNSFLHIEQQLQLASQSIANVQSSKHKAALFELLAYCRQRVANLAECI